VLRENLTGLATSVAWLTRSLTRCSAIGIKPTYTADEYDAFENLSSRYARTTDLLVNKVLRSLDRAEFIDSGTIIDVVNRAAQRGIVDSVDALRDLKDLRNEIAHEYSPTESWEFFDLILNAAPKLLEVAERVAAYCEKYTSPSGST
jgi:hypothetical protein